MSEIVDEPDWGDPELWTRELPRLAAEIEQDGDGPVPTSQQHRAVERLLRFVAADSGLYTVTATLPPQATDAFHDAARRIVARVDDTVVLAPRPGVTDEQRLALLLGAGGRTGHTRPRVVPDRGRGLDRVTYLFTGPEPAGLPAAVHTKTRAVDVLGRTLLRERIAWLPAGTPVAVDPAGEVTLPPAPRPGRAARYRRIVAENRRRVGEVAATLVADARVRRRARRAEATARYRDAWLLMDRDTAAGDNAEHLYRHLRAHEPDVNAWFVLSPDSPDWDRLRDEGFRLLAYASPEHFVALLHCVQLVSSQVDSYVVKPFRRHLLGPGRWRYTFLQHGVIKDDLSRWLNAKRIDVLVVSTPDEHRSIVADDSHYAFTDLETRMVGLARHDRLLRLAGDAPGRDLVVMPTWRRELLGPQPAGNRRGLLPGFWDSDYARGWRALLESDELRELCRRAGWRLRFVPHPNMQDYLATSPLPPHVEAVRFGDVDVQQVLADAAVVVTDYSSLATEAAYVRRPVVYFQFDRDSFFAGGHVYRQGDWSYPDQGFGPVTTDVAGALAALTAVADGDVDPEYARRAERTFPFRDGRCCERTVAAIRAITSGT